MNAISILKRIMDKLRSDSGSTNPMEPFAYDRSWENLAKEADAAIAGPYIKGDIRRMEDEDIVDALGVDRFSLAMKAKLEEKRLEGYGGWHNDCTVKRLRKMLVEHVERGDPVDIANFAMMIWNRQHPAGRVHQ